MGIIVENNIFTLHTNNSSYQMKVDDKGSLIHTYYGKRTDETDYSYLIALADRGFSGNVPQAQDERTYSLDFMPQEFPVWGSGDYRVNCLQTDLGSGVDDCLLVFDSYKTYSGKYALQGLPAMFASEHDKVDTLEITLKDYHEAFYVHLLYGVFEDYDVITRAVVLENKTNQNIILSRIMSACLELNTSDWDMIHFYGRHARGT